MYERVEENLSTDVSIHRELNLFGSNQIKIILLVKYRMVVGKIYNPKTKRWIEDTSANRKRIGKSKSRKKSTKRGTSSRSPKDTYPYTKCGGRHKIPEGVKREAKIGLQMHKDGFAGGTKTGWDRAKQLVRCTYVSDDTVKIMRAWYARHKVTSKPGYQKWVRNGKPTDPKGNKSKYRGAVAYLIWGGLAGEKWMDKK